MPQKDIETDFKYRIQLWKLLFHSLYWRWPVKFLISSFRKVKDLLLTVSLQGYTHILDVHPKRGSVIHSCPWYPKVNWFQDAASLITKSRGCSSALNKMMYYLLITNTILLLLLLLLSRFSRVRLCATPQTAAHQAPPSLGFSRQEHWSGLPLPSPMHESEKWKWSSSVVSNSSWPHGLQPTRLLCPWDFPGKSAGVGCHCLLCTILLCTFKSSLEYV